MLYAMRDVHRHDRSNQDVFPAEDLYRSYSKRRHPGDRFSEIDNRPKIRGSLV